MFPTDASSHGVMIHACTAWVAQHWMHGLTFRCIAVYCVYHPHGRSAVSCCRRLLVSLLTSLLGCCGRVTWLLLLTAEAAPVMLRTPQVTLS